MFLKITTRIASLFFTLSCVFTSYAHAQSKGSSVPRFSVGLYGLIAQGKMGNGLLDAADRDMLHSAGAIFVGFNMKKFRLGANYEINSVGQTTSPSAVSNTNISGKSTAPGVRFDYYDGKNSFGLVYRLSDEYKLDKLNFNGALSTYKGSGGISVQYMRQLKKSVGLLIDYTTQKYNTDPNVQGNIKWSRVGIGLVFSNFSSTPGKK